MKTREQIAKEIPASGTYTPTQGQIDYVFKLQQDAYIEGLNEGLGRKYKTQCEE